MTVKEIMEAINYLEDEFPVDRWIIDGVHIWPIIRFELYFKLVQTHVFKSEPIAEHLRARLLRNLRTLGRIVRSDIVVAWRRLRGPRYFAKRSGHVDAVFVNNSDYLYYGGKYYDRYCDPVIEELTARGASTLLVSLSELCPFPRTPAVHIRPRLRLKILAAALPGRRPGLESVLPRFDEFHEELLRLDASLNSMTRDHVSSRARTIIVIRDYILKILRQSRAKVMFQVSYYNVYGIAAANAARLAGIPSVELQHGTQGDFHVGYGRWRKLPPHGFNTMPEIFACWDEQSASVISSWSSGYEAGKPIVFGNRFLEHFKDPDVVANSDFAKSFRERGGSGRKNVLVALQNVYGLPQLFESMLWESNDDYFWWIRFHPVMTHEERSEITARIAQLNLRNVEMEAASSQPLYAVLPLMDVHVTLNSSVVHEAAQFGIPSIVCDETARDYYANELARGDAVLAMTPKELSSALSNLPRRKAARSSIDSDALYEVLGL